MSRTVERRFAVLLQQASADVLVLLRSLVGLEEVSKGTGISPSLLSRYANQRSLPSLPAAKRIAHFVVSHRESLFAHVLRRFGLHHLYTTRGGRALVSLDIAMGYYPFDIVIGFADASLLPASIVAAYVGAETGVVWQSNEPVPVERCSVLKCSWTSNVVLCYSFPEARSAEKALVVYSPFKRRCANETLLKLARNVFASAEVYRLPIMATDVEASGYWEA
jgi:transcriptional regulator with XRE-family HTH domain